jgi:hypothetical protein
MTTTWTLFFKSSLEFGEGQVARLSDSLLSKPAAQVNFAHSQTDDLYIKFIEKHVFVLMKKTMINTGIVTCSPAAHNTFKL